MRNSRPTARVRRRDSRHSARVVGDASNSKRIRETVRRLFRRQRMNESDDGLVAREHLEPRNPHAARTLPNPSTERNSPDLQAIPLHPGTSRRIPPKVQRVAHLLVANASLANHSRDSFWLNPKTIVPLPFAGFFIDRTRPSYIVRMPLRLDIACSLGETAGCFP